MSETMEHIFGPAGILVRHLPEHEARPGQQRILTNVTP